MGSGPKAFRGSSQIIRVSGRAWSRFGPALAHFHRGREPGRFLFVPDRVFRVKPDVWNRRSCRESGFLVSGRTGGAVFSHQLREGCRDGARRADTRVAHGGRFGSEPGVRLSREHVRSTCPNLSDPTGAVLNTSGRRPSLHRVEGRAPDERHPPQRRVWASLIAPVEPTDPARPGSHRPTPTTGVCLPADSIE